MPKRAPFIWNGIEHWVGADLVDTVLLLDDEDSAADFILAYAEVCREWEHNLGYLVNIIRHSEDGGDEEADRLLKLLSVDEQISPIQWFDDSSCGTKPKDAKPEPVEA